MTPRCTQLGLTVACGCGLAGWLSNPAWADGGFIADQAVVELVPGASIDDLNADYGTVAIGSIQLRNIYLLELPGGTDELEFQAILDADHRVAEAEVTQGGLQQRIQIDGFDVFCVE